MLVGVEKIQSPVVRLDWGDGKTKSDVTTDIFFQWHAIPPQTIYFTVFGTYQEIVSAGTV